MTDPRDAKKAERERLQAEALKANLRRRKAQSRAQKEAAETPAEPGKTRP
ncbi:MAG: hypothetical protein QM698_07180 [Micropepsaceae bacterium]